jgi:hypothetical protein
MATQVQRVPRTRCSPAGFIDLDERGITCGYVHRTPEEARACTDRRHGVAVSFRTLTLVKREEK